MAAHWIEHIVTTLFFVGLAALIIKAIELHAQVEGVAKPLLEPVPAGGQPAADCERLLGQLAETGAAHTNSYLVRRLRDALEHVRRKGAADTLDAEIKYLSDMDAMRAQHGYAFVRIIIWAIPILGLLGTVIGITLAVANLSADHLDESLKIVVAGLGLAFDHTALALVLSMILMFGQFAIDRSETRLMAEVDARMNAELVGRFFAADSAQADPQMAPVRRMIEAVIQANERLVTRQAELWQATIEAAHEQWSQVSLASGQQLETALGTALDRSLKTHAAQVLAAEQASAEQNGRQWSGVQSSLVQTSEALAAQQTELRKQSEVLLKVVSATGQITELEDTLNRNLSTLSGAKHFEDAILSLSAAIHLLTTRVAPTADARIVELSTKKRSGQAA